MAAATNETNFPNNKVREVLNNLSDDELFELTEKLLSESIEDNIKVLKILGLDANLPTITNYINEKD